MRTLKLLLFCHVALLVLASTNFSAISWLWGDFAFNWNFHQFTHKNGWGFTYVSVYPLQQVLCYIFAYGLGVVVFAMAWLRHRFLLSAVATLLCIVGAVSFCIEATHWLWAHHFSWITSAPGAMIILWIILGVQLGMRARKNAQQQLSGLAETPEV